MWKVIQPKLIVGESIAQTVQFVQTGNAQIGFISLAHALSAKTPMPTQLWRVPADLYPLIEQGAIVTAKGKSNPLAARYLEFLQSEKGRMILHKYGFVLPEKHA